eukprot:14973651-Ditylum_brightwellii.AAC.1
MTDAEVGSGFDPPVIPFIPKTSTFKVENSQEFNLCISATKKDNTNKFKAHTFLNGSPKDILEWEKKMQKMVKCKPVDTAEDAMMSKKPNVSDTASLEMCNITFAICLQG